MRKFVILILLFGRCASSTFDVLHNIVVRL